MHVLYVLSLLPTYRVTESAFAPYVGFGVLMTSKLGADVILMRYVTAISPIKIQRVDKDEMVSLNS